MLAEFKIVFFGDEKSGKTKIIEQLYDRRYTDEYTKTKSFVCKFHDDLGWGFPFKTWKLWDTDGTVQLKHNPRKLYSEISVGVICIDLSKDIDEKAIQNKINEFRLMAGIHAKLILVGTKADKCLKDTQQKFKNMTLEEVDDRIVTSAKNNDGIKTLQTSLVTPGRSHDVRPGAFFIDQGKRKLDQPSDISPYQQAKLNLLYEVAELEPKSRSKAIQREIEKLEIALGKEGDKARAIVEFSTNCHEILEGKYPTITNAILTFLVTAMITMIAGIVGFLIGTTIGLWTGPGAPAIGLIAAIGAATAVAPFGFAIAANSFFGKSSEVSAMEELVLQAQLSPVYPSVTPA